MKYAVELFSGSARITKAINSLEGWKCYSIDYDQDMNPHLCMDIFKIKSLEHLCELLDIPRIDFIWASPDCTSYSLAAGNYHRLKKGVAKSDYAKLSDKINNHLWNNILIPAYKKNIPYIVENPRGYYRKMNFVSSPYIATIYYSNYEKYSDKPTDLFYSDFNLGCYIQGQRPQFNKMDSIQKNSYSKHHGENSRSHMPQALIDDIAEYVKNL